MTDELSLDAVLWVTNAFSGRRAVNQLYLADPQAFRVGDPGNLDLVADVEIL